VPGGGAPALHRWPRLHRASYGSPSTRPHGGSLAPLAAAPVLREGGRGRGSRRGREGEEAGGEIWREKRKRQMRERR